MRYDGTRATLRGVFHHGRDDHIEILDHLTGKVERIQPVSGGSGHGGGDEGLMAAFVRAVRGERQVMTDARASLESHLMAFAAEQARLQEKTIYLDAFRHDQVDF